eukprot:jgi/Phyca11/21111/fgenesh1_pg.PHYCAscaffold_82_\
MVVEVSPLGDQNPACRGPVNETSSEDMARTRTITVPAAQATKKPTARTRTTAIPMSETAQTPTVPSTTDAEEAVTNDTPRREEPGDEETKGDHSDVGVDTDPDVTDPKNSDEPAPAARQDSGTAATAADASTTMTARGTAAETTALPDVLLQLSQTMNRMNDRLDNLELAVATTMSRATAAAETTATAEQGASTARRVTHERDTSGDDGGDDESSSSSSEDDDGDDDDGREDPPGGTNRPAHRLGPRTTTVARRGRPPKQSMFIGKPSMR